MINGRSDNPLIFEGGNGYTSYISLPTRCAYEHETSSPVMVFSLLEEEKVKWQKVGMRAEDIAWIEEASRALE